MHRRHFLRSTGSCCAHVYGLATFAPALARKVFAVQDKSKVVAEEKWGRLEQVQEGVWILISTPFESRDFTTVCNGGIVAGRNGVLAIEAFMQDAGAMWLAEQAKKLTGKRPTDVVCTHYHADHSSGHAGFAKDGKRPNVWLTEKTQQAAEKAFSEGDTQKFEQVQTLSAEEATEIVLGNRKVKIVPRSGHTSSDVTIELVDPKVIWSGDLFFNGMFPNYKDAIPERLNEYVGEISKLKDAKIVPGHGPVADNEAVKSYQAFLEFVQEAAENSFEKGIPASEAAKLFKLPETLDKWLIWSPDVVGRGYEAWYRTFEARKAAAKPKEEPQPAGGKF